MTPGWENQKGLIWPPLCWSITPRIVQSRTRRRSIATKEWSCAASTTLAKTKAARRNRPTRKVSGLCAAAPVPESHNAPASSCRKRLRSRSDTALIIAPVRAGPPTQTRFPVRAAACSARVLLSSAAASSHHWRVCGDPITSAWLFSIQASWPHSPDTFLRLWRRKLDRPVLVDSASMPVLLRRSWCGRRHPHGAGDKVRASRRFRSRLAATRSNGLARLFHAHPIRIMDPCSSAIPTGHDAWSSWHSGLHSRGNSGQQKRCPPAVSRNHPWKQNGWHRAPETRACVGQTRGSRTVLQRDPVRIHPVAGGINWRGEETEGQPDHDEGGHNANQRSKPWRRRKSQQRSEKGRAEGHPRQHQGPAMDAALCLAGTLHAQSPRKLTLTNPALAIGLAHLFAAHFPCTLQIGFQVR